jgi:hypothetical protein
MKMRLGTLLQILGWILFAATIPFIYLMFTLRAHGDYGHTFWTYTRTVIVLVVLAFACFFFSLSFANMLCLLSTACAGIWQILALLFFGGPSQFGFIMLFSGSFSHEIFISLLQTSHLDHSHQTRGSFRGFSYSLSLTWFSTTSKCSGEEPGLKLQALLLSTLSHLYPYMDL